MKVLLIQPPIRDFYRTRFREYPLGLLYLASSLEAHGHQAQILDARQCQRPKSTPLPAKLEYLSNYYTRENNLFIDYKHFGMTYDSIAEEVGRINPDIICISSMFTPYVNEAIETARAVKAALPKCPVIMGGYYATVDPDSLIESGVVDCVVQGEGERILPEIISDIMNECNSSSFKSEIQISEFETNSKSEYQNSKQKLLFRSFGFDSFGFVSSFESRHSNLNIRDHLSCGFLFPLARRRFSGGVPGSRSHLDSLPFPARHLIDADRYRIGRKRYTMLLTSRGCPHRCSFCSTHAVAGHEHRTRSIDSVIEEVKMCVEKFKIEAFDFQDDNLLFEPQRIKMLLERIIAIYEGRVEFMATNGLNAINIDREMISLMKRAGFRKLDLALGTGGVPTRAALKRPEGIEQYERVLSWASELEMPVTTYIILGIPTQPIEEMRATIAYLKTKKTLIAPSIFYNVPGMPIFDEMRRYEYLNDHIARRSSAFNCFGEDFTREDIFALFKEIRDYNLAIGK